MTDDREAMLNSMLDDMAEDLKQETEYNPDNTRIRDLEEEVAKLTRRHRSAENTVDNFDKQQLANEINQLNQELENSRIDYENANSELVQSTGLIKEMVIAYNELYNVLKEDVKSFEELQELLEKKNWPTISQLNDINEKRQRDRYLKARGFDKN